jgi:hypothetical protein
MNSQPVRTSVVRTGFFLTRQLHVISHPVFSHPVMKLSMPSIFLMLQGLFFVAVVGYLLIPDPELHTIKPVTKTSEHLPDAHGTAAASNPPSSSTPIDWSRIEADDYPTYISNLRKLGCPERTIRDIVVADVVRLYAGKLNVAKAESTRPEVMEKKFDQLRHEENDLLQSLLGPLTSEDYAQAQNAMQVQGDIIRQQSHSDTKDTPQADIPKNEDPPTMPLAFVEPDAKSGFDQQQMDSLGTLRQRFINDIGGPNQDPNDSGYKERWQEAQPINDELFRTWYGNEALNQFQIQAASNPGK